MNTIDYQTYLFNNQADLEDKILLHLRKDSSITFNKDLCLEIMETIIASRMKNWITNTTVHPEQTSDFNPTAFFLSQWIHNIYPSTKKEIFSKADSFYATYVSLDSDHIDLPSNENLEEETMVILFREELKKANEEFISKITKTDQKVFYSIYKELTDKEKVKLLFPDVEFTIKLRDKVRYMVNVLEFRYSCFLLSKHIYDSDKILRKINKMPRLVKKYFDTDRLLTIPDMKPLLAAAFNTVERKPIEVKPITTPTPFSKTDFNGKKHDHFVVYKMENGLLYDHVTKNTKEYV